MSAVPEPLAHRGVEQLRELEAEAAGYAERSRAANTLRAYRSDWRAFCAWCDAAGKSPLPADPMTIALYLTDAVRALRPTTLRRRLASIAVAHRTAGLANPCDDVRVQATWSGIRRTHGTAPHPKDAITIEDLRTMVAALPNSRRGKRDACLLLLGFAAALRRSELVALCVGDVTDAPEGLIVMVRRSKTDQEAEGREIGVPYGMNEPTCPVRSLRAWRDDSGIASGPLFRPVNRHDQIGTAALSDKSVALIVKRAAEAAGLDPTCLAGHSLRSGMATTAARAGASEAEIMNQTGHRSIAVLRRYIRRGSLFNDNASKRLGL